MSENLRDFHRPAYRDWRWLETCWFSFFVPAAGIRGHLRAAFRTNLDVAFGMVNIYSRGGGVLDMDFFDSQMHLPIGAARYSDFLLANGLSVKGHPAPDEYTVRFHSRCGRVQVELECEALMPPVTLEETGLEGARPGFAAFHRAAQADAPVGHIDQTFRVTGWLQLDGERHAIECVANHDHSWSPRAESRSTCGTFDNFHFGEELTLLTQGVEYELGQPEISHGYILRGRELRRLREARVTYERLGHITRRLSYALLDSAGERYQLEADVSYSIEQDQGSNGYTVMNFCRPRWGAQVGVGESMWHWDIPEMQRRIRAARAGTGISAAQALSGEKPR